MYKRQAKRHGIPVGPGRGSGAGSIAAYCMGITGIDTIKYNLLFERFLNPERVRMPDIDVDFCYERREEVIDYVIRKYVSDHFAQIVTFGTLAARASIRDVGRALGIPYNLSLIHILVDRSVFNCACDVCGGKVKKKKDLSLIHIYGNLRSYLL